MKKYAMAIMVFTIFFTTSILARANKIYDMRDAIWGMSKEEVVKHEHNQIYPVDANFMLAHEKDFNGLEFLVAYMFMDDRLVSIIYLYSGNLTPQKIYKNNYNSFVDFLTEKFGKPTRIKEPSAESLKNPTFVPQASGNWENEKTKVIMHLSTSNEKTAFRIIFHDVKFTKEDAEKLGQGLQEISTQL